MFKCVSQFQRYNYTAECDTETPNNTYSCMKSYYETISYDRVCDGVCDCSWFCDDEAVCNGYTYGRYCVRYDEDNNEYTSYIPPYYKCDGYDDCSSGIDEERCSAAPTCASGLHSGTVPLNNRTRCAVLVNGKYPYCEDYTDQLNCSDPDVARLSCLVGGHMTSVADRMVCHAISGLRLCDNGLENWCEELDYTCHVHKHVICDGVMDCESGADEAINICR